MGDKLHPPITRSLVTDRISEVRCLLLHVKHGDRTTDMSNEQVQRILGALELAERAATRE